MPTQKAQLEFILQSLKEAIERMRPDLVAANDLAHKADEAVDLSDEERVTDRMIELGELLELAASMCDARVRLIGGIARLLDSIEHEVDKPHPAKHERPSHH
jgi:SpoU rRNA methylase family enzyme